MNQLKNLAINIWRSIMLSIKYAPVLTVSLTLATIFTGLIPLYQAKVMGNIVNSVIETIKSAPATSSILMLIVIYSGVWALNGIISSLRFYFDRMWSITFEQGLELEVMKKRSEIDLGHYESPAFQNLLTQAFNRGIWPIYNLVDIQMQIFASLAVIAASSFVTTAINPLIYIIIIATSIPTFIVNIKYGHKIWSIWGENSERRRTYEHIYYHFRSRTGVVQNKLLQGSTLLLSKAKTFLENFKKEQLTVDQKRTVFAVISSIIAASGYAVSFWLIVKDVTLGLADVGVMVFLINIIGQLVGSISQLLSNISTQFERNQFANDIFKVLDTKPYVPKSKNPVALHLDTPPTIELKNVWFKYEGREDWILKNINMTISPKEKIAIVGENGAGKSTLIKLLSRVYDPTQGVILVNGIDLRHIDNAEWGTYLAVLLQDYLNYDFNTIESIAMGRSQTKIDKQKVIESAQLSGADEFIKGWKQGYDQQLGKEFEGGIEPSKGQIQKIALARVIYRSGFVLILDEPTAAIDAKSEMEIFNNMKKAAEDSTLVLITHRFNTTQNVDTIHVIEHGEIKESGNHKELLKQNGRYAEMFRAQAKSFLEEK